MCEWKWTQSTKSSLFQPHMWCNVAPPLPQTSLRRGSNIQHRNQTPASAAVSLRRRCSMVKTDTTSWSTRDVTPPLSHPSLPTLVSSHLCTQADTKTNRDKLASSGLSLKWPKLCYFLLWLGLNAWRWQKPHHPLMSVVSTITVLWSLPLTHTPLSVAGENEAPFTRPACTRPSCICKARGLCGGCSQRCVILIRQDQ